jgi:uncharacterized repeat protein (TIGR03803 family)
VFRLNPSGGGVYTENVLYSFAGAKDGALPNAPLILDANGGLYGTTNQGGGSSNCFSFGCGTVFKLTPVGGAYKESVLHGFQGGTTDGAQPDSSLFLDFNGALYGTTFEGGSSNCSFGCGTVFKLTPASGGTYTESVLYSFKNGADGGEPAAPLVRSNDSILYGTTFFGTVFKLTPANVETVLANTGVGPAFGLISPAPGVLYGVTQNGGAFSGGSVFQFVGH